MLIEHIPADELKAIDQYRQMYAYSDDACNAHGKMAPIEHILREWDAQKSKCLFQLLGDRLMVSKRLEYEKSYEELQEEIANFTERHYGRTERNGREFYRAYKDFAHIYYDMDFEMRCNLLRLISDDCLISNRYDGDPFDLPTEDGKVFKVLRGCKTAKALGKIASLFNLPGYEDFRICLSQVLNQKKLGGRLTISIHPLDYMTMSDNESGWESCMSWRNEGGYRQGTVEMMNSPAVVVAYLSAEEDMRISYIEEGHQYWNNKKWRSLFVVDPRFIVSIKDYPYHNDDLTRMVVEWLAELGAENCAWQHRSVEKHTHLSDTLKFQGQEVYFEPECGAMYNDFGCLDYHWMAYDPDFEIQEQDIHRNHYNGKTYFNFYYSGKNECMICGSTDTDFADESCLACEDCQDRKYCDCCGDLICGESIEVDGMCMCEYCYENRTYECANCGEVHLDESMVGIFIIPRYTKEEQKEIRDYHVENHCNDWFPDHDIEDCEYIPSINAAQVQLCDNGECMSRWIENNMLKGHRPHLRSTGYNEMWYAYYDELTPEAQDEWCWGYDNNPDLFRQSFRIQRAIPTRVIES